MGTDPGEQARALLAARESGRLLTAPLVGVTTLDHAYAVQRALLAVREARGERLVGWKLGYTSLAMREQMGISAPNLGPLTDPMVLPSLGSAAPVALPAPGLHPRVEPEIVLRLVRPLEPGCTRDDVLAACAGAWAGLEVVDSVWDGYRFRLEDNTADGSSAGWFVLGDPLPLNGSALNGSGLDALPAVGVTLSVGGEVVGEATGAAAGGDPLLGVVWLAEQVAVRHGRRLEAGQVVLTGGLTAAVPLLAGSPVSARFASASGTADVAVSR